MQCSPHEAFYCILYLCSKSIDIKTFWFWIQQSYLSIGRLEIIHLPLNMCRSSEEILISQHHPDVFLDPQNHR